MPVRQTKSEDEGEQLANAVAVDSTDVPKDVTEAAVAATSPGAGVLQASDREKVTETSSSPPFTGGGASTEGEKAMLRPAPSPQGTTVAADVTAATRTPPVASSATFANAWADFGGRRDSGGGIGAAGLERRFSGITIASATLATPTNSDVSSVMTPSSSWAEDVTPAPAVPLSPPATRAAGEVSGGVLFPSKPGGWGKQATVVREGQGLPVPSDEKGTAQKASSTDSRPVESGTANENASVSKLAGDAVSDSNSTLATMMTPGKGGDDVGGEASLSPESPQQGGLAHEDGTAVELQDERRAAKPPPNTDETENSHIANREPSDEAKTDAPSGSTVVAVEDPPTLRVEGNLVPRGGLVSARIAAFEQTGSEKKDEEDSAHQQATKQLKEASLATASDTPSASSENTPGVPCENDGGGSEAQIDIKPACNDGDEAATAKKLAGTTSEDSLEPSKVAVNAEANTTSNEIGSSNSVERIESTPTSSAETMTTAATTTASSTVPTAESTAAHVADPPSAEARMPSSPAAPENVGGSDAQTTDSANQSLESVAPTLAPPKATPEEAEKSIAESEQPQGPKDVPGASAHGGAGGSAGGIRSIVLAGPERVFSIAEAAEAHSKSPLLGASGTFVSVASRRGKLATVAVVDLWNEGATTR